MNYELAKQLKDAGFPHSNTWEDKEHWFERENHVMPTLEELIEACGEKFCCLYRIDRTEDGKGIFWSAGYDNLAINHSTGHTPAEAVAYLYLSLHAHLPF